MFLLLIIGAWDSKLEAEYVQRVVFIDRTCTYVEENGFNHGVKVEREKKVIIERRDAFNNRSCESHDLDEFPMLSRQGPYSVLSLPFRRAGILRMLRLKTRQVQWHVTEERR